MDISKLTIVQLKNVLRANNIKPLTGNKAVLVQRVIDHVNVYENHIKVTPDTIVRKKMKPRNEKDMTLYENMTVAMLKDILKNRGISSTGTKGILINRLKTHDITPDEFKKSSRSSRKNVINDTSYENMTVVMLKEILKTYKLKQSGKKAELINRIISYENSNITTIPTQTIIHSKQPTIKREPKIMDEPMPIKPFEDVMDIILPKVIKNIPQDMTPILDNLYNQIDELQQLGLQYPDFKFKADNTITSVAFLSVLEKYKNPALIVDIAYKGTHTSLLPLNEMRSGFTVVIPPKYKGNDFKIDYKTLGTQLQHYKNLDVICIPFNFVSKQFGPHANMLIYRPKLHIVEQFEPNGSYFGDNGITEYIQRCMINLFENQLTKYIGNIKYIGISTVCPTYTGLQRLSNDSGCAIWSVLIADFALSNPNMLLSTMIPKILDIAKNNSKYVRNIINGYILMTEKMMSELLQYDIKYIDNSKIKYEDYHGRIHTIKKTNKIYNQK